MKKVTIEVPDSLYIELERIAAAADKSLSEVIAQSIRSGMPPSLSKVPSAFHDELLALNKLSDRDLIRVVEGDLTPQASEDEQHRKADFAALCRMYALSLLKWRGHPIPAPYESLVG
ncbi:MAG: ribbon-helix-helix protein, CopG family [Anaerolineales bacterium]|nr:ribbon-helix-helix protein, CopG family [Anaerolineales bacterium]